MKQYWLFGGLNKSKAGGFFDFQDSYDDAEIAYKVALEKAKSGYWDFYHIVDSHTGQLVIFPAND